MHPIRKLIQDHAERIVQALSVDPQFSARLRNDAGESAFLSRELEAVRASVLEIRYPEFKGRRWVPVVQSINAGAEEFRYKYFDEVAQAEIVKTLQKHGPRADVFAGEATAQIRSIIASYAWSIQEMRASMMAGTGLDQRKARAARKAIEKAIDDLLLVGDANIQGTAAGLFTLSGTQSFTTTTGTLGSTLWSNKTSDEILDDLFGIEEGIYVNSKELEQPNMLLLPISSDALISRKRMGDGDSQTVKSYFLANSKYIKTIETSHKLESNTGWTGKRMVAYHRDPDVLEALLPVEFEQFPPQWEGFESITDCHARCGGVILYRPKAVSYGDNI
jgi:hypothetical protein